MDKQRTSPEIFNIRGEEWLLYMKQMEYELGPDWDRAVDDEYWTAHEAAKEKLKQYRFKKYGRER